MTEQTTKLVFLKSSRKRRIAALIIDHFVMTFLMVSITFLVLGPNFMNGNDPSRMITIMFVVMIPGFILYFAKDSIKGVSFGKWIMGIMVRDENNQSDIPSFGRLFLRNLFIIIWPVEFIVLAVSDEKSRLGDKIAKTTVVKNPDKPSRLPRITALIGVGITSFVLIYLITGSAIKNSDAYKVATKEMEKNKDIINETGGIEGYGMMPTGNISISNGQGQAQLEIKALGRVRDVDVSVYLEKEPDGQWKLIEIRK